MRFCSSCGWTNPDTAASCRCGKPLGVASKPAQAQASRPKAKAPNRLTTGGNSPAWFLAAGLVILAFGALNVLIQRGVQRFTAAAGVLMGLSLVAKGVRGFQQRSAPLGQTHGAEAALSIWRAPWLSFYSGRFYDDVGRRGRGAGLLYLLALEATTWLVSAMMVSSTFLGFVETEGQRLIAQVPPISIRDGKVKVEATQPYFIRLEATGPETIALDTTGEIKSLEGQPELALLLTENKLHTRQRSGQIRIYDLSTTKSFEMNQAILSGWVDRYTGPVMAFGYSLAVLASFVFRLMQALLYAAIGLGFASLFKKTLSYGGSVRMSIAAVTPVILVDSILGWAGVTRASGFLWWGVCLAAALGFLAFGVKSLDERGHRA